MPLINTSVPTLIQGVSQQSNSSRFVGQCEEQENALSSIVDGLKKRSNTRHIAKLLSTAIDEDSFVHFINRSDSEKYVIIHDGSNLRAFNILTGNTATINGQSALSVSGTYLDSNPKFFKALTITDNTLLLNTSRITQETPNRTDNVSSEALIFVKQGDYGTKYGVSIQGNFEPQAGDTATASLSSALVPSGGNYTINNNPSIGTSGSGYEQGYVSVTASSTGQIISQPQFNVTVNSNGGIGSIVVLNGGSFAPVSTGTTTVTHNFTINNYLKTENNDPYGTYQTYRTTISFDLNITSGSTSHLTVGQSVTVALNASNYITTRYFSYYKPYDEYTQSNVQLFTGTLTSSNTISVSKTYTYTVNRGGYYTYYFGTQYYSTTGLISNSGTNTVVGSFTSQQPTYGVPTVTLTVSSPTTSVNVAKIEANIKTPDGSNAQDFTATGDLANNNHTPDRDEIDTSVIADNLRKKLQSAISTAGQTTNFQVTNSNNLVVVSANTSSIVGYTISASDGLADTGLGILYKEVGSVSDLPIYCKNDFVIKVAGEQSEYADDYYVKFQTNDGSAFGRGVWIETVGFDQTYELDSSTMPHLLASVAPDEFKFSAADGSVTTTDGGDSFTFSKWENKNAGDSDTNPSPSFVKKPILNLLFFKNRVGFITESSVVLSESGQFFNFYRTTVSTLLDTAPIDVEVASNNVTSLKASTSFQGNLILFSDNEQFVLKGGDILTPKTVSITSITNFSFDAQVDPLSLGSYIYFPFNRGNFTGVREFSLNSTTDTYDSVEITEHVPSYIHKNVIAMTGTTSEDVIAILSNEEKNTLYIYSYFWNGNQKVLGSWSKFTFRGEIRGMEFDKSTLYLVTVFNDETHLVQLPFTSGVFDVEDFLVHLDMRVKKTVLAGNDEIDLPYFVTADDDIRVFTKDGIILESTSGTESVTLSAPVAEDTEVFIGIPYKLKYTFSEQIFKTATVNGKSPSNASKVMLRTLTLFYDNTAAFDVIVTPEKRDGITTSFTSNTVDGSPSLENSKFRISVFTKAEDTDITIQSKIGYPCSFQSAEFESFIHPRSNRIA